MRDDLASLGPIPEPLPSVPFLGLGIDHIFLDSPDPSGPPLSHRPFQTSVFSNRFLRSPVLPPHGSPISFPSPALLLNVEPSDLTTALLVPALESTQSQLPEALLFGPGCMDHCQLQHQV